jgi:hypothetical protein
MGATRNLVIRGVDKRHSEEDIREHAQHIHNLVIIKVAFEGRNAFISTNSVHNAMFLKTCMMSRQVYKAAKIEWAKDECAIPIPTSKTLVKEKHINPKVKILNRFEVLDLEGTECSCFEDLKTSDGPSHSSRTAKSDEREMD